jgi:polyisoprenoid-binding protein YceI
MATKTWALDPTHSELQFKVKHLMITNVTGQFKSITASVNSEDENFKNAEVSFSAQINSIDTANEQRDGHLKSADFFDGEKFPEIKFVSKSYNASEGKVTGDLTIKDVTKAITLDAEFSGTNKDPWGNQKAGFSINGKINRTDFNLNWNAALETGGVLVSEEVKLAGEFQFVMQS